MEAEIFTDWGIDFSYNIKTELEAKLEAEPGAEAKLEVKLDAEPGA
jgi:hypothetical protein